MTFQKTTPAILALEDGSIFQGDSFQSQGQACGELVFNTAQTGYQEILTDCSYAGQMVTFTCPHIGNVGTNAFDGESDKVWPSGIIVRSLSHFPSNWRSTQSLPEFLQAHHCLAIGNIDTRALTQKLRDQGSLKACIMIGKCDPEHAVQLARSYNDLEQKDFTEKVSTAKSYEWTQGTSITDKAIKVFNRDLAYSEKPLIVVYDFGVKQSILRCLVDLGCKVWVVPAAMPAEEVLAFMPDGILLSNGPGDPKLCHQPLKNIRHLLDSNTHIPMLGICLGHQLLTLALGGKTRKMKFGHHGANHPVQDLNTQRVFITSQNHNFMMDQANLPKDIEITHRSLFDGTPQGLRHRTKPIWGFQGHPEASPGPHDARIFFNEFLQAIRLPRTETIKSSQAFSRVEINA